MGFIDNFRELWNFLVPERGRAQTAQGEVIRIAGRISDELMRNGGLNWDEDYQNMFYTFRKYLVLLEEPDEWLDEMVDALKNGDVYDGMIWRLRYCALSRVEENPEVMPLLEVDYTG